jgi:hypothetical protein
VRISLHRALACSAQCLSAQTANNAARAVQSTSGAAGGADVATKQAALNGRAYGQFKSVAFLCFIMWMSGSQIHLFSIMTTVSGIYQPLMAIFNSEKSAGAAAGALCCFTPSAAGGADAPRRAQCSRKSCRRAAS